MITDYSRTARAPRKPQWAHSRDIIGWDTETVRGRPFCLSWACPAADGDAYYMDGPIPVDILLRLITPKWAEKNINVWYNLDFDATTILAGLPVHHVCELVLTQSTMYGNYDISFVPAKFLSIRLGHKTWTHYDVSQFFAGGLDKAAKEWLGRSKMVSGLDISRFNNDDYRETHKWSIIRYAKTDAELVRDLYVSFSTEAESAGIPCGKPFSTGFLAEQTANKVFRESDRVKPGLAGTSMQAMARDAYFGGRFEVFLRGSVGAVQTIDITSAYPHVMTTLPDPATLEWALQSHVDNRLDYGLIDATVSTSPDAHIHPFPRRSRIGRITYPVLTAERIQTTLPEWRAAIESGIVTDYAIHHVWAGGIRPSTVYPWTWLAELFIERQTLKTKGRSQAQRALKLIINSIYGKTCQTTTRTTLHYGGNVGVADFFPSEVLPHRLRIWAAEQCLEVYRQKIAGSYYNPFFASYTTGTVRARLYRDCRGLNPVMVATDSIMVPGDMDVNPLLSQGLGAWEREHAGDAFVVGSGIYEINEGDRIVSKTRGVESGHAYRVDLSRDGGLRRLAGRYSGESSFPITRERPLKMPQALWQNIDIAECGQFREVTRGISAGMDRKRMWPRGANVTWGALLDSPEISTPLGRSS